MRIEPFIRSVPRPAVALATASLFAAVMLVSCSDLNARIRRHTYPPDFHYIAEADLRSAMWQLAKGTHELDRLLHDGTPASAHKQQDVVSVLTAMQRAADSLGPRGRSTNHPSLNDNAEPFRRDLASALEAAGAQPPNYFLAGYIAGSCLVCHSGEQP